MFTSEPRQVCRALSITLCQDIFLLHPLLKLVAWIFFNIYSDKWTSFCSMKWTYKTFFSFDAKVMDVTWFSSPSRMLMADPINGPLRHKTPTATQHLTGWGSAYLVWPWGGAGMGRGKPLRTLSGEHLQGPNLHLGHQPTQLSSSGHSSIFQRQVHKESTNNNILFLP